MLVIVLGGCGEVKNSPQQVAESFVKALHAADKGLMDPLMAWDSVAVNQFYVSRGYYGSLTSDQRREVDDSYREMFFSDYFPLAAKGKYLVDVVYEARGTSNAIIFAEFGRAASSAAGKDEKQQFTLQMRLIRDRSQWYIVDLNDFVQLNYLQGDFDPETFYLPEPVR